MTKRCQQCGCEFACGLSCCWCDEIVLDPAVRRDLVERFSDCLCRTCLETAAGSAGEAPPHAK